MFRAWVLAVVATELAAACGGEAEPPADASPTWSPAGEVPATEQRAGDPEAGYDALVNEGYVSCGLPYSAFSQVFGPAPAAERLPGRNVMNETMSYGLTRFVTRGGVDVVSPNCLNCHAGWLNGELVVGLGDTSSDYTVDYAGGAVLAGQLIDDPLEEAEWQKFSDRMLAIAPYVQTRTVGVNPADNIAAVLFAHRDRVTLAWSLEPILDLPPPVVVPVDVPPWWRMQKKHAMFYVGAGRGDHARIMMSASALCTDTVEEAAAIDAYFPDVRAFLLSLVPPAWPWPVDAGLAAAGETVFYDNCSQCHGTYGLGGACGPGGAYPNLIVEVEEVGTDEIMALGAGQFAGDYVDWFNESFYGERSFLAPAPGYYAPPLDGVWATAPYLHNGSVPTLAALLESSTRPRWWSRTFDSTDYDPVALGWRHTALDHGQDAEPDDAARKLIYDTTLLGYGNGGHTYGDSLSASDRQALLEYLKTI